MHHVRDGRHRRRLRGRRRAADRRRARAGRRAGQQRRLRLLRRGRGRADRRGATPVRGQRVRPGAARPSWSRPTCAPRGRGRIINVSSIGGKFYEPLGAWYHATKFAVEGFSDSLRVELAPYGIQVVIIEPGPILTEWNEIARDSLVETQPRRRRTSSGRGTPRADGEGRPAADGERPRRRRPQDRQGRHGPAPRPRYPVGKGAGSILAARRVLPDRTFDSVVRGCTLRADHPCVRVGGATATPAAFSRAATSSSRWSSSRCRCGTVRRQPVRPNAIWSA